MRSQTAGERPFADGEVAHRVGDHEQLLFMSAQWPSRRPGESFQVAFEPDASRRRARLRRGDRWR
jgi:hypothetical protein